MASVEISMRNSQINATQIRSAQTTDSPSAVPVWNSVKWDFNVMYCRSLNVHSLVNLDALVVDHTPKSL